MCHGIEERPVSRYTPFIARWCHAAILGRHAKCKALPLCRDPYLYWLARKEKFKG